MLRPFMSMKAPPDKSARTKSSHMNILAHPDSFAGRHIGPTEEECRQMLDFLELASLDALIDKTIPRSIRLRSSLRLPEGDNESAVLARLIEIASKNQICRSFLGMGYHDCVTPAVIQRNILENPGWYTQYTTYQPEISQGRLEALLNFQTMVADLTGLPVANASLLDEGTAAAEAMHMLQAVAAAAADESRPAAFLVSDACHPQTIEVVRT